MKSNNIFINPNLLKHQKIHNIQNIDNNIKKNILKPNNIINKFEPKNENIQDKIKNVEKLLQDRNKELTDENNKIKKDLKEKISTINAISEQYANLLSKNNAFENQKKELTQKINVLEQNNNNLTSQVKKFQESNVNLNNMNSQLKNELDKKSNALIELTATNRKLIDNSETQERNIKLLKEKIKSLSKISDNFEKCQKLLNEKNNLLLNAENKINMLNEDKQKQDNENLKAIEEYNRKIDDLEKLLNKKKIEYDSLKKELDETHSKFDGSISHYEKMDNQMKEQEKKLEELSVVKEENEKLKEKNLNYEQVIKKGETKDDYLMKQAEEYYDVVIDIKSINSLKNEGWSIKYNQQRKEIYDKIVGEQTIKIGVLGLNNVGKSFLLSKIVRAEIPTGYSIETKGISIKYAKGDDNKEEKGVCILDSAGFETPLLKEEKNPNEKKQIQNDKNNELENAIKYDEVEDELSRDKAQTERFIEQLIISLSDMIILVIGKLTRTEQRLITRIKNMSKKNEKNKIKSIIIVHNLAQYHKIKEVEKHIKYYLTKSATFDLSERDVIGIDKYRGRKYFFENSDDSEEIQVFHYVMAKEGTEAGDYYNYLTMELIRQQYNNFNKRRAINIPDEIINLFSELSTDIIGEKMECQKSGSDKNVIKLAENQINKFQKKKKIRVQNAYIDQDGNYLKNKGKFEPKYSLYYYKEKKENEGEEDDEDEYEKYLLLRLEIPGNIVRLTARSTDPKTEKFNGIVIKGIKKNDEFKEKNNEDFATISDNRSYDEFTYFIELKRNLELTKSVAKGFTDIYEIEFDKRNKEKNFPKEANLNNDSQKSDIKLDNKKNNEANDKNNKEKKLMKIASGVYVMKFQLTDRSYIPNK